MPYLLCYIIMALLRYIMATQATILWNQASLFLMQLGSTHVVAFLNVVSRVRLTYTNCYKYSCVLDLNSLDKFTNLSTDVLQLGVFIPSIFTQKHNTFFLAFLVFYTNFTYNLFFNILTCASFIFFQTSALFSNNVHFYANIRS